MAILIVLAAIVSVVQWRLRKHLAAAFPDIARNLKYVGAPFGSKSPADSMRQLSFVQRGEYRQLGDPELTRRGEACRFWGRVYIAYFFCLAAALVMTRFGEALPWTWIPHATAKNIVIDTGGPASNSSAPPIVDLIAIVAWFAVAVDAAFVIILTRRLLLRLQDHHPRIWENLGSPTMVWNNSISNSSLFSKFLRNKEFLPLGDAELTKLANNLGKAGYIWNAYFFAIIVGGTLLMFVFR
jgi:hypothetical protein